MNIKREEVIKYGVAILAILNLIWLFGFQYRLPGKAADNQTVEEAATASATAEEAAAATTTEVANVATTAEAGVSISFAEEEEPEADAEFEENESEENAGSEENESEENAVHCRVIGTNNLNIREGPGTGYKIVATAKNNEVLTVLDFENGWVHVRKDGGQEGYVAGNYVEIVED